MPALATRNARRNAPRSRTIRWAKLSRGRALGYRRPDAEAGTWYVRVWIGDAYRTAALGRADDKVAADSVEVLDHGQAVEAALAWGPEDDASRPSKPWTVGEAVENYLGWHEAHRKSTDRIASVFQAHVLPELGHAPVEALTPVKLRRWHEGIAGKPARLRGGQEREAKTEDAKRARKVTANHALTALKAALNRAVEDGRCELGAWTKVKPFRGVDTARARYLETEEFHRLLNVAPPDFRELLTAALHTGARYGELASIRVGDYLPESAAVHLAKTKTSAPRTVFLSGEAVAFFDRLTAGRRAREPLLTKADSSTWGRNHQSRPMREACQRATIEPAVGFHQLRHTYASHYLMNGGSLIALAKQLGHSTTRMVEKHYGHLADTWRAEEARRHALTLGRTGGTVTRLRKRV